MSSGYYVHPPSGIPRFVRDNPHQQQSGNAQQSPTYLPNVGPSHFQVYPTRDGRYTLEPQAQSALFSNTPYGPAFQSTIVHASAPTSDGAVRDHNDQNLPTPDNTPPRIPIDLPLEDYSQGGDRRNHDGYFKSLNDRLYGYRPEYQALTDEQKIAFRRDFVCPASPRFS